jgi:ubiquitin C-terminal hydrolase
MYNSPINASKNIKKEENLFDVVNKEIGIKNLGNTCFINSCLQIIIHCQLFIYKLIKNSKLINEKTPITSNFLSICKMMMETEEQSIDISNFKNLLSFNHKLFEGYLQNDSQEFCRILLEDISRELNEVKIKSIYRLLSNSDKKSKKLRDEDFHKNFTQREKSIITEIFYAQIVNIFTCECKAEIYSFQKILDFPLLFPENINNDIITLKELLKLYFQTENIDFESKCDACHKIYSHKKEIKISRPPEILILSLQRIDEKQEKLRYKVEFPQILDIYPYVDHDCGYDRECKYNLYGIVNHEGRIDFGHYFSFIKIGNKNWFKFNDSLVSKIDKINDCSEDVYALFYVKQKYNYSRLFNA